MYSSEEIKKMNNNPNIPVEKSYELSDKEQALLDFIKTNEDVTIKLIELQLGATYVGALGKLISNCLVKSEKRNLDEKVENKNLNQYGKKFIKCYFINLDNEIRIVSQLKDRPAFTKKEMRRAVKEVKNDKTRPSMQGNPEIIKLGEEDLKVSK